MYAAYKALQSKRLIVLERSLDLYNCTQGQLLVNNDVYDTLELPWRENKINISRIPTGVYTYQKIKRASNGSNAVWLRDVPGRGQILIHYGTKPSHTKGCILLENYEKFHSSIPSKGLITIL